MNLGLEAESATRDIARELGIRGVPIDAGTLSKNGVAATLAPLSALGLQVCQIGAFGFNALRLADDQKALLDAVLPLAAETGCPYVVIGPGNYHSNAFTAVDPRSFTEDALDAMARVLEGPLKLAEKHEAKISIEAVNKGCIGSPERFLQLKEKVGSEALCCNIDPTSLYDFSELLDSSGFIAHLCRTLAGHYGIVHIKEVALKEGFHLHADMVPVGEGNTDWAQFLAEIAPNISADSWVMVEHCKTADEARNSIGLIRAAAKKAGVTLV
jgi:sugar phosphate isomerase/epimerase